MKKIYINQIYRWHGDQPPAALVEAFNAALACATMPPDTKMRLHALGETLEKQITYAQKTHRDLQTTYMLPGDDGAPPSWIGEDEETQKANEAAFMEDFGALLNTEIEIRPIPLSALQKASDRYWLLHERGLGNGAQPIDSVIGALMPIIADDINPPEPVHTNGDAPPQKPAQPTHRQTAKRKRK
jgi:hypothetical protein